jgi:hypothetical protein
LEEWHAEILMKGKMPGSQKASKGINYITDPVVFSREMLGFSPDEQQCCGADGEGSSIARGSGGSRR